LPVLRFEVTEHHAMQAICSCGHVHTAQFPAGVDLGSTRPCNMAHAHKLPWCTSILTTPSRYNAPPR
jgi:hypothetical protein